MPACFSSAFRLSLAAAVAGLLSACSVEAPVPPLPTAAQPGVLLVGSEPGGAQIRIDGEPRGSTPEAPGETLSLALGPGRYLVEAHKPVDEFGELVARHEGLEVGSTPLPALLLKLEYRLTEAGRARRAEEQENLLARDQAAIARFEAAGEGTVIDTATGLMWMRCTLGQQWTGSQCTGEPQRHNWPQAMELQGAVDYGGYSDWRLPSKDELLTITWCSSGRRFATDADGAGGACAGDFRTPAILLEVFPDTPAGRFWSSTPGHMNFVAWGVAFTTAVTGTGNRADKEHVRMVREVR